MSFAGSAAQPSPARFPFFQGPPLVPWAPRGWLAPPAATEPVYEFDTLVLEGELWDVPGGKLYLYWEGPPGLCRPSCVVFVWDLVPDSQGLMPRFHVYTRLAPGSMYFIAHY